MAALVTMHVQRPGWERLAVPEQEQVRSRVEAALRRIRTRDLDAPATDIAATLTEDLAQASGGRVVAADVPLAAAAIRRGDYVALVLEPAP